MPGRPRAALTARSLLNGLVLGLAGYAILGGLWLHDLRMIAAGAAAAYGVVLVGATDSCICRKGAWHYLCPKHGKHSTGAARSTIPGSADGPRRDQP